MAKLPSSLQPDRPTKLLQKQPGMLLGLEKRILITERSFRGDIWSLLKAEGKEKWVIKVQIIIRFSLKRWCHVFEDLPLHLI